jgi:hypothetical protein
MNDRFHSAQLVRNYHAANPLGRRDVNAVSVGFRSVGGMETAEPCITAWVDRKLPKTQLSPDRILPRELGSGGVGDSPLTQINGVTI